ncbi:recombinase family protein [Streptomyces mirabilis]|uniref:recombinase family protein n=1 Tax=Streptomyces mirabilis TaxID=68239 RepID=UPI00225BC15F|nr:recombinase family protein [Streptomyces mirabilis]MCX4612123.1 recombinase family protein [Streptomyces mirabilis]
MTNSTTAPVRAAIYTRVASVKQNDSFALKAQEDACRQYAEAKGWTVADVYQDQGVSGTQTSRPEFERLITDADAGRVDAVLVYRFDRVARTIVAFFNLVDALRLRQITITSVTQDLAIRH